MKMNLPVTKPRRGRPPKVSRENQDTKAELIRSGLEQLTESGFASSGIDQILKKVKVPKGSFYHYFASKEAFGQAVIENYASYFAKKLDACLLDESYSPLTRISNFVESAKIGMVRHQFKRGCLVGNLGQEVDLLPESFRQQLIDIFQKAKEHQKDDKQKHRVEGYIQAGKSLGIISNEDALSLMEKSHFHVFGETIDSRKSRKANLKDALARGDDEYIDIPAYERNKNQ